MKKQLEFDLLNYRSQVGKPFGGSKFKGNPKTKRPFSSRHYTHLILKSSKAKGAHSFLARKHQKRVNQAVRRLAGHFGVELREYANVGNHLHLLVKARRREQMSDYLRALAGVLVRIVMGCEKGNPLNRARQRPRGSGAKSGRAACLGSDVSMDDQKFWDARPYTKIVAIGLMPFRKIRNYFEKNRGQAQVRVEGFFEFPDTA